MIRVIQVFFAVSVCIWAFVSPGDTEQANVEQTTTPQRAIAVMEPTQGNDVKGTVFFVREKDGVRITGEISGLTPGKHAFHIHEYGDESAPDAMSAGRHLALEGRLHGKPGGEKHEYGDLGNITANDQGVAKIDIQANWMKIPAVLGRGLIIHAKPDAFQPPAGQAGPRVAIGIIGIANPDTPDRQ